MSDNFVLDVTDSQKIRFGAARVVAVEGHRDTANAIEETAGELGVGDTRNRSQRVLDFGRGHPFAPAAEHAPGHAQDALLAGRIVGGAAPEDDRHRDEG